MMPPLTWAMPAVITHISSDCVILLRNGRIGERGLGLAHEDRGGHVQALGAARAHQARHHLRDGLHDHLHHAEVVEDREQGGDEDDRGQDLEGEDEAERGRPAGSPAFTGSVRRPGPRARRRRTRSPRTRGSSSARDLRPRPRRRAAARSGSSSTKSASASCSPRPQSDRAERGSPCGRSRAPRRSPGSTSRPTSESSRSMWDGLLRGEDRRGRAVRGAGASAPTDDRPPGAAPGAEGLVAGAAGRRRGPSRSARRPPPGRRPSCGTRRRRRGRSRPSTVSRPAAEQHAGVADARGGDAARRGRRARRAPRRVSRGLRQQREVVAHARVAALQLDHAPEAARGPAPEASASRTRARAGVERRRERRARCSIQAASSSESDSRSFGPRPFSVSMHSAISSALPTVAARAAGPCR